MTNETRFMDNDEESLEDSLIKLDDPIIEKSGDQNNDEVTSMENATNDEHVYAGLKEDQDEDSVNVPIYKKLNPDIFDAELDSNDEEPADLASLPNKQSSISDDDDDDDPTPNIDPKLAFRLAKGAAKRERRQKRCQVKANKDEKMEIHSETQRIIRESRVQIPYHNPVKQGISSVLEKIRQKREIYGTSLVKSSLHANHKFNSLFDASQSKVSQVTKDIPIPSTVSSTSTKDPVSVKMRLNFGGSDDDDVDDELFDREDLMTRILKNMEAQKTAKKNNEEVPESKELKIEITGDLGNTDDLKLEQNVSTVMDEVVVPVQSDDIPKSVEDESKAKDPVENKPKSLRVRDLLNLSVDPTIVPKLGRRREGDDLIIEKELTGMDKLFLRLEKEMAEKKKKTSVELCTASKLSTQSGGDSFQVKKITYKMEEKAEVKISSRGVLKETLQSQMRASRKGRLHERYEQYKQLGLDRGTLRLEEDHPSLPDEDDDDDFGGDDSSSESGSRGEMVEIEDEEEAAVERHEKANPFIEHEAEDDDDDDDDDHCAIEGDDDDDHCAIEGDDDDDVNIDEEKEDDDDIIPIKKRCPKIIDDDDDDDSNKRQSSLEEKRDDEKIREAVNIFDEDAMSGQGIESETKIPSRPFEDLCTKSSGGRSTNLSSHDSRDSIKSSSTGNSMATNRSVRGQKFKGSLASFRNSSRDASNVSLNLDADWLFSASDNHSVSQVIQGICSTQKNENIANFCSGDFGTQNDLTNDSMDVQSVPSLIISETHPRKRKREADDYDDESDDNGDDAIDGRDDDVKIYKIEPLRSKGKINEEFVEKEAELSGSEDEDDDDETGLDDVMDHEEGDDDDVGTEEELRKQVHRVHLKTMIDQDKREIRLLQEQLLEDGDLHDDDGLGRLRRFRWKNLDDTTTGNEDQAEASDDDDIKEGEDEARWRMIRLERERFLQKHEDLEEETNKPRTPLSGCKKLKLVSSFVQESPVTNSNGSITPQFKIPSFMSKTMGQKPVGSFLARSKESLSKFSDPSKNRSTFSTNNNTVTMVSRNSKNFVFAHISPGRNEETKKENGDNKINNSKTPKSGGKPPRKKQNLNKDTPLPPSRILKFLNE